MRVHLLGRLTGTGQTAVLHTGEGDPDGSGALTEGRSPFTEGRTAVIMVSPSQDWAGSNEKVQASADGGMTWTDLMTAAEIATIEQGQVFMKTVTLPNRIRGSATRTAGNIAFYVLGSGA